MLKLFRNERGIVLIEAVIALLLTGVAVISIMAMQTMSIKTAGRSDYLGRAAGVLQAELEFREGQILRNCIGAAAPTKCIVTLGTVQNKTVNASDPILNQAATGILGDVSFNVATTATLISVLPAPNQYLLKVQVTWTGNSTGIKSSMLVMPQTGF